MKWLNKFGDWVVEKDYRYWIVQYILYVFIFFCACITVSSIFVIMTR